jgi:hypothetical protein
MTTEPKLSREARRQRRESARHSALQHQVGGSHYKTNGIQHTTFCQRNRIPWNESSAIKYLTRHRNKNGLQDLEKAEHYLQLCCLEEYLLREEAGLTELQDMNPKKFPIPLAQFVEDNDVPPAEAEIMKLIIGHQVMTGEATLMDAIRKIQVLKTEYPSPRKAEAGAEAAGMELL